MASGFDWRRWRGFFAALLVLAFTAAPEIDRLICGDSVVAEDVHAHEDHAAEEHPPGEVDHDGACHHGHCHHGGGFIPAVFATAAMPDARRQDLGLPPVAGGAFDRQFGLMRPPRA